MPDPLSAGIGAAVGVAQLVTGAINNRKAKKAARELERTRPMYNISQQAKNDLSFSEADLASGGLSSGAESAYNNLNNQQFSSSLNAILKGGGSVNNVGSVFGANEEGRQRLALLNDQMRLQKINNLNRARQSMLNEEDKAFMYNIDAPYKDKAQAVSESRRQAQGMIGSAIGSVANTAQQYAGQAYNEKMYRDALGKLQTSPTNTTSTNSNQASLPGRVALPTLSGGPQVTPLGEPNLLDYPDPGVIDDQNDGSNFNWLNIMKR